MDSVKKGPDRTILPAYPAILRTCGTVYTCGAPTAEGAEADRNYLANLETCAYVRASLASRYSVCIRIPRHAAAIPIGDIRYGFVVIRDLVTKARELTET